MALRHRLCALALAGLAGATFAADTPPTKLHLVGDHWTAWNPPASLPPDAKIHIVQKGDTLWALSAHYLGNPYLWPQIWEKNQYVLDAHWIYPGDPLIVGIEVAPAESVGATTEITSPPVAAEPAPQVSDAGAGEGRGEGEGEGDLAGGRVDAQTARRNTPVPLGSESDIYCTGYIGDLDEEFGGAIIGSEFEDLTPRLNVVQDWAAAEGLFGRMDALKYELTLGDVVYLDGGRSAGLSVGQLFTAIEPRAKVRHPVSGDVVGRFYAYTGRIRVLTVQEERAIAEVVQTCAGVHVGARLRPFQPEPIPLARPPVQRPVNDPTTADLGAAPVILHANSSLFTLGQDHVVFIDRGESDDVLPGDLFTIYRISLKGQLPIPVGELAVLSVHSHSAVAKILESRYPVYVGDRLERR
ncbi:MAG TPA: LysM peptidoglycan-binding domain-containing protein [Thermoanaerobaculia bacterium]|nr:LysM peptidoglycan-binding domain-containing protein [Thermoanaerobaculia bacterium]